MPIRRFIIATVVSPAEFCRALTTPEGAQELIKLFVSVGHKAWIEGDSLIVEGDLPSEMPVPPGFPAPIDLELPISSLHLDVRGRKMAARFGIKKIGELLVKTGDELLECNGFGRSSLSLVRMKLARLGLRLRNDP